MDEGFWAGIADKGRKYELRDDGYWVRSSGRADVLPIWGEPLWMLQLIRGVFAARESPERQSEPPVYRADLSLADQRSPEGIAVPPDMPLRPLRAIPMTAKLRPDGLIAEAGFELPEATARLRVFDFDEPAAIDLPPEDRVIDCEPPKGMGF